MPGPGARDGIHKCFDDLGGLSETDIIRLVTDRQEYEFEQLGLEFRSLWGRPLQLIDCQNLFCEVSKYARVVHPDVEGSQRKISHQANLSGFGQAPRILVSTQMENQSSSNTSSGVNKINPETALHTRRLEK